MAQEKSGGDADVPRRAKSRTAIMASGRRVSLAAAAMILVLAAVPSAALASGGGDGCNPNRPNNEGDYQEGAYEESGSTLGGVRGNIRNYSPFVYHTLNFTDTSSQWVMLLPPDGNFYQDGWYEQPYGTRYTFAEADNSIEFFPADPINSVSTYTVDFRPPNTYDFYDNGKYLAAVTAFSGSYPNHILSDTETHTEASQMPGGYDNTTYMTNGGWFYPAGPSGSWHSVNLASNALTSWAGETVFGNYYYTWDNACPY